MAVRAQTEDRDARGVTRPRPGRICVRTGEGAASCVCERAEGCAARRESLTSVGRRLDIIHRSVFDSV